MCNLCKNILIIPKSLFLVLVTGVLFLFNYTNTRAQIQKASATIDTNVIRIGQQVKLNLSLKYRVDAGVRPFVEWPVINDSLSKHIEVIKQTPIDTIIPDKNDPFVFVEHKTLYVTSFDSGYWAIAPFKFVIKANNKVDSISTEAMLLQVNSVPVDTTKAIKDIKMPFKVNYTFIDWLKDNKKWVLGILLIVLATAALVYYFTKKAKNKPQQVIVEKPKIPDHILAIEKLDKLKQENLWQQGKIKNYYIALTDIMREYIEGRFRIPAMEQTTDEILKGFRNVAIDNESKSKLKQMLALADLVKFAKEQPLPQENENVMEDAYSFIEGTKREEDKPKSN